VLAAVDCTLPGLTRTSPSRVKMESLSKVKLERTKGRNERSVVTLESLVKFVHFLFLNLSGSQTCDTV